MVKISNLDSFCVAGYNCCHISTAMPFLLASESKIDVLCTTEMHSPPGDICLTGRFLKSGGDSNDPAAGVGMILSEKAQKALIYANAISPRILLAKFRGHNADITVIVVYIPQQGRLTAPFQADTYKELSRVSKSVSDHDCKIIVGDMNGRLGRSDKSNDYNDCRFVGRWSIHNRDCPGGILLRQFLKEEDLCAVSTMFQPPRKHTNATWINHDKSCKPSQIDHIMVSNRWKSNVSSCKVYWGTSINRWGKKQDHGEVRAQFHMKTRVFNSSKSFFDVSKLRDPACKDLYSSNLSANLASVPFTGVDEDHNGKWLRLKKAIVDVATESLKPTKEPKKKQHFTYMSAATLQLVNDRIAEVASMKAEGHSDDAIRDVCQNYYKRLISKSLKDDHSNYVDGIIRQMEAADAVSDIQKVHSLAAMLQGKGKRVSSNLTTDEQGNPLVSEEDRLAVWRRYYEVKFAKAPTMSADVSPTPIPVPPHLGVLAAVSEECPTYAEVEKALGALRSGKSPGIDEIPVELIRASPDAIQELTRIIASIWQSETVPEDWSKGLFVNIYKGKGCKNKPVSYRPVCLLSHAYKAFAVVLLTRLRNIIDARIRTGQEGFRSGRGCADNLFVLRAAISYAIRNINETKLEVTLIDFTQAFDTVSHEFLRVACDEHGIPPKYCRLIGAIYKNAVGYIKGYKGSVSEPFGIFRGVLQGDILSPILFVLCLNSVWLRSVEDGDGWRVLPDWLLDELSYADDIALFDCCPANSERRLQKLSDVAGATASMIINVPKTLRAPMRPKVHVGATTAADVTAAMFKFKCDVCGREFDKQSGLKIHKSRWCNGPGTGNDRSRRDQRADKIIKAVKLDKLVAAQECIKLNGESIANVARTKYLGALIMGHGTDDEEVEARIDKARATFMMHHYIWRNKDLSIEIKLRLFKVRVLGMLLYGGESWTVTKQIVKSLRGFVAKCYASIKHSMRKRNNGYTFSMTDFDEAMRCIDVIECLDKRRWSWLGHTLRMQHERNPRRALDLIGFTPGSLLSHLPHRLRDRNVNTNVLESAVAAASDRSNWKQLFDRRECVSVNVLRIHV